MNFRIDWQEARLHIAALNCAASEIQNHFESGDSNRIAVRSVLPARRLIDPFKIKTNA